MFDFIFEEFMKWNKVGVLKRDEHSFSYKML